MTDDCSTDDTLDIETAAHAAWPAEEVSRLDDWVMRASGGFSRRNNSVQPADSADGWNHKLLQASEFYRDRDLPLIFRITPLNQLNDRPLGELGYSKEGSTDVMVADISDVGWAGSGSSEPTLDIQPIPSECWIDVQADWLGIEHRRAWEAILQRSADNGNAAFGLLLERGEPTAVGLAVVKAEQVGLFEITVAPSQRRAGRGFTLSKGLLWWGKTAGARRGYVQVEQRNQTARKLYDSLGFVTCYSYWYRRAPTTEPEKG